MQGEFYSLNTEEFYIVAIVFYFYFFSKLLILYFVHSSFNLHIAWASALYLDDDLFAFS